MKTLVNSDEDICTSQIAHVRDRGHDQRVSQPTDTEVQGRDLKSEDSQVSPPHSLCILWRLLWLFLSATQSHAVIMTMLFCTFGKLAGVVMGILWILDDQKLWNGMAKDDGKDLNFQKSDKNSFH